MAEPAPPRFGEFRRQAWNAASQARVFAAGRPEVRTGIGRALKGIGGGIGYGLFIEPRWIERTQIDIPVRDLPRELDGYRIVHLSDIHYNIASGEGYLHRVIDTANALDPDLVALTGDFITHDAGLMGPCMERLSRLRAADGLWAVRGNHDAPVPLDATERLMNRSGIRLLENRHELIAPARHRTQTRNGAENPGSIVLAGVGDMWTAPCLPGHSLAGASRDHATILLSHNPGAIRLLPDSVRVDLVLSGHTHGGQVRPFERDFPMLSSGETTHVRGLGRRGETAIYVSRGVGTSALHFRWNCRPEIALLVLRRAD